MAAFSQAQEVIMEGQEKQQIGDGQDHYGQAASQMTKAARELGNHAALKGAETAGNAAAASVSAGVETGKAVSNMAAGTAMGGPWGAALSAAWAMRHTLFKILICICLLLTFFVILIVSLPSIVTNPVLGINGNPNPEMSLAESYEELCQSVSNAVEGGYHASLARVEQIILEGGYDYDLSMEALINHAQSSAGYDVSYILAAYSASMEQKGTSEADMITKLNGISGSMFPVTQEEKEHEREIPVSYQTYNPVTVTVAIRQLAGIVNGIPRFNFLLEDRTYYVPGAIVTSAEPVTIPTYRQVSVQLPVYTDGEVTDTTTEMYYQISGEETVAPSIEIIKYVECTIHPFDNTLISNAFGLDLSEQYPQFNITYGEAIQKMAYALKMTLYGSYGGGQAVPLTDSELIAFVNGLSCSEIRKHIITTALSLVGKVPYFWGGKSEAGWNDEWNTPKLVTAAGSSTTGTIRPYGLDCSGFTDWVYKTAVGVSLYGSNWSQWDNSYAISEEELLPGDLGFLMNDDGLDWNHVLIFAGYGQSGERLWVHSTAGEGVTLNTPSYEATLRLRRPKDVDFDAPLNPLPNGEPLYALEVDVTHYCACTLCCGSNAQGITASGKPVATGMVAMSSHYPFGTQIMINGILYTVEDRGGSGIENDISRVDIYVPDHNQALQMGRYQTTAYIYRIGR